MHDDVYSRVVGAVLTHVGDAPVEAPSERGVWDINTAGSLTRTRCWDSRIANKNADKSVVQISVRDFGHIERKVMARLPRGRFAGAPGWTRLTVPGETK